MTALAASRTSSLALAALVAGIAFPVCAVLALVGESDLLFLVALVALALAPALGLAAHWQIRRSREALRGRALANVGIGIVVGWLLLPMISRVREPAARMAAGNNMKQIGLALHQYAEEHGGRLPPAASTDAEGRPLLSWRVLLLPYLEQQELYKQFHLDEPWDSPHNRTLLPRRPRVYTAPDARGLPPAARDDPSVTFTQAFVGKGTAFEGPRGLLLPEDFPDGPAGTVLAAEAGEPVPWTKPADLAYDPDQPLPPLGGIFTAEKRFKLVFEGPRKGFHALMGDGSVHFLRPGVSDAALRAGIARDDGRVPDF